MKPSNNTMISFYQQLGKIFYSMAAIDKKVRGEEITKLKEILRKEWVPLENSVDEFGTDSAFQIEIVFDWLLENNWDPKLAIDELKSFKQEHSRLFTDAVKQLILKTANAIGSSFSGMNKAELVFLTELKIILTQKEIANTVI